MRQSYRQPSVTEYSSKCGTLLTTGAITLLLTSAPPIKEASVRLFISEPSCRLTLQIGKHQQAKVLLHHLCRDASGQGWNQSMTVELMVARKRWLRTLKLAPTGLAVNTICRLLRTCNYQADM